jgi:peptidoglycan/xylan/chitin deacetylase (PgdA/CDA1 family)
MTMKTITWRSLRKLSLTAFRTLGGFQLMLNSAWRRERLLILCYHGVSIDDEHEWNPALYMPQHELQQRLEILRASRASIVPLHEGIARLYAGTLPERSVVITFDDGYCDFRERAHPVLRAFGVPVTVYLTTLRCERNLPIFRLICPYLFWKSRGRVLDYQEIGAVLDLRTAEGRVRAFDQLNAFAVRERLDIYGRNRLAAQTAARLGFDYEALTAQRILTIMAPDDVRALSAAGVRFELHTHTHTTPTAADIFEREISKNRAMIEQMTHNSSVHFCYPSGVYRPELLTWLRDQDMVSATTCDPGLACRRSNPLLLPRFVDSTRVSGVEFEGWVAGAASFLSRTRSHADSTH